MRAHCGGYLHFVSNSFTYKSDVLRFFSVADNFSVHRELLFIVSVIEFVFVML